MKKSNWIILAVLVIASVGFLALWYALDFHLVDNPLDLTLTGAGWVVVLAVVLAIRWAENKRRESIRTAFVAPGSIFNPEAGTVALAAGASPVAALQSVLSKLSYGTDLADMPSRTTKYDYVVRTTKFADDGAQWEGEVLCAATPDAAPRPFRSRAELQAIL